jgi:hypothetical protein
MLKFVFFVVLGIRVAATAEEILLDIFSSQNDRFKSTIHRVKLYSNNLAEVAHQVSLNKLLSAGYNEIIISGFPVSFQENSLQLLSTSNIEVHDYKVVTTIFPIQEHPLYSNKITELTDRITLLQKEKDEIQGKQQTYESQLVHLKEFISSLLLLTGSQPTGTVKKAGDYSEAMKLQQSESERLYKEINFLKSVEKEKQVEMDKLLILLQSIGGSSSSSAGFYMGEGGGMEQQRQQQQYRPPQKQMITDKQIYLHVTATSDEAKGSSSPSGALISGDVFLRYFVQPASWEPKYEITIENNPSTIVKDEKQMRTQPQSQPQEPYLMQLGFYAKVYQNTGMDWENIELSLSTTAPEDNIERLRFPERKSVSFAPQRQHPPPQYKTMAYGVARSIGGGRNEAGPIKMTSGMIFDGASPEMASGSLQDQDNMMPASLASVSTTSLGYLDSSYLYQVTHKVNLTSQSNNRRLKDYSQSYHHIFFMKEFSLPIQIFTYLSPAQGDRTAYRMAFGKYPAEETPLLPSSNVRITIESEFVGEGNDFPGMNGNQYFMQSLGKDQFLKVFYSNALPMNARIEEDRSTWFVKDSVKYKIVQEDKLITIKNTHKPGSAPTSSPKQSQNDLMLYVIAENIPVTTDEEIKITFLSPKVEDIIKEEKTTKDTDNTNNNNSGNDQTFLENILRKEYEKLKKGEVTSSSSSATSTTGNAALIAKSIYYSKSSGTIFWALWINHALFQSEISIPIQYKIVHPENKPIYFQ